MMTDQETTSEESKGQQSALSDLFQQSLAQARSAADSGDFGTAATALTQAAAILRDTVNAAGGPREGLIQLSVLLYNLANYLSRAGRFDDAVATLEEVVALDDRAGHRDLEADRQALAQVRALVEAGPAAQQAWVAAQTVQRQSPQAAQTRSAQTEPGPAEGTASPVCGGEAEAGMAQMVQQPSTVVLANSRAQLEKLPPEMREVAEARLNEFAAQWDRMDATGRLALLQEMTKVRQGTESGSRITQLAARARDSAMAALRGELSPADFASQTLALAGQVAEGQAAGSPAAELATYLRAVVAVVRGEPVPQVHESYADYVRAVQDAAQCADPTP